MVPSNRLEEPVAAFKDQVAANAFALTIVEERRPSLTSSKIGGLPHWPRGLDYPEPMRQGLSSDERLALLCS